MTTATQLVNPDLYYGMVCERLADFDDFCKAKCAERESLRKSVKYSLFERLLNLGVDPRIEGRDLSEPYNWLDDFDYYSQYVIPYRVQYKRLTGLEVWLAYCVNQGLKVQISASDLALLLGEWK